MGARFVASHSWTWKASFVATRILAVYLAVHALVLAGTSASLLVQSGAGSVRWSIVIAIIVLLGASAELWLAADAVSNRVARVADEKEIDDQEEEAGSAPSAEPSRREMEPTTALSIGLTILGLLILIDAASAIILEVGSLIQARAQVSSNGIFVPHVRWGSFYLAFAALALRAAVGAWLAFGSQDIARFFRQIRSWPSEPQAPNP